MFEKRKEVVVHDQPPEAVEPQVVEKTVYMQDRRPRFLLGFVVGVLALAGAVALSADQKGSYRLAGAEIDHSVAAAQRQTTHAAHDAAGAVERTTRSE